MPRSSLIRAFPFIIIMYLYLSSFCALLFAALQSIHPHSSLIFVCCSRARMSSEKR